MKLLERRGLVNGLLVASGLLNLAMLGYLAYSGSIRRLFIKLDLADVSSARDDDQRRAEDRFRGLPSRPGEVVFAGDSLIALGPWADFYTPIHNRGIIGETTSGLLGRLDEITEDRPARLVLLVGANDLASAVPPARILANYRQILERIRDQSPASAVDVVGVLPVNRGFPGAPNFSGTEVGEVNRRLRALVAEFPRARFVDLSDRLADGAGVLRREFTDDGIHLKVEGYLAIRDRLEGPAIPSVSGKPSQESAKP